MTEKFTASVQFAYRSAYEGERGSRVIPDEEPQDIDELRLAYRDLHARLTLLQADLADPACVELVIFGDSFPTQHWRK